MDAVEQVVWKSLATRHAGFAEGNGIVKRYRPGVADFWAAAEPAPEAWAAIEELAAPDDTVILVAVPAELVPTAWTENIRLRGHQMILDELVDVPAPPDVRRLGPHDVPAMLALVELTNPGPFRERTIELGEYYGVVRDGRLLAMAGQRFHLTDDDGRGYHELSAVATHPDARGQGLAASLSALACRRILDEGETPMLHVVGTNAAAISVYRRLGFEITMDLEFAGYSLPR